MKAELKRPVRERLPGVFVLKTRDTGGHLTELKIYVEECIGEGSVSICYNVRVETAPGEFHRMLLRQFYPDPFQYELDEYLDGAGLVIRGYEQNLEVKALAEGFDRAFDLATKFANDETLMEHVVRPVRRHTDGSSRFILYAAENGQTLNRLNTGSAVQAIERSINIAEALQKMHDKGVILIDLSPENITVSGSGRIMFFDFDASCELDRVDELHTLRGRSEYAAPELLTSEFDQNKRYLLSPQTDIYAFGVMMFHWFTGTYPDRKRSDLGISDAELKKIYESKFRGELTEAEQAVLTGILRKCLDKRLSMRGRYSDTGALAKDLKSLLASLNNAEIVRRVKYRNVATIVQAAYIMYRYPLDHYVREVSGGKQLVTAIVGDSPISRSFFRNIVCSMLPDTGLTVLWAVPDAKAFLGSLLKDGEWPELPSIVNLYLNGSCQSFGTSAIIGQPAATVRFYDWDAEEDAEKLALRWDGDGFLPYWIVAAGAQTESNLYVADGLAGCIERRINAQVPCGAGEDTKTAFIGYAESRGDGYDFRYADNKLYPHVTLAPFGINNKYSPVEQQFHLETYSKAKQLFSQYEWLFDERLSKEEIDKRYLRDRDFVVELFLSEVLSLRYKIIGAGCDPDAADIAEILAARFLEPAKQNSAMPDQLAALERRRFCVEVVLLGYKKASEQQIKEFSFRNGNCELDPDRKLHAYLTEDREELLRVRNLIRELAALKVKDIEVEKIFDPIESVIAELEESDRRILFTGLRRLKEAASGLIGLRAGAFTAWNAALHGILVAIGHLSGGDKKDLSQLLTGIEHSMAPCLWMNGKGALETSGIAYMRLFPRLMEKSVEGVLKPAGRYVWEDAVAAMLIRPRRLVLLANGHSPEDLTLRTEKLDHVLNGMRNMGIAISWVESVGDSGADFDETRWVIDVSGNAKLKDELTEGRGAKADVVFIQRRRLVHAGSNIPTVFINQPHLTVRESLELGQENADSISLRGIDDAVITAKPSEIENLKQVLEAIPPLCLKRMRDRISGFEKDRKIRLIQGDKVRSFVFGPVSTALLRSSLLDMLLMQLSQEGVILSAIPEGEFVRKQQVTLEIVTRAEDLDLVLERLTALASREPYYHVFTWNNGEITDESELISFSDEDGEIRRQIRLLKEAGNETNPWIRYPEEAGFTFVGGEGQVSVLMETSLRHSILYPEILKISDLYRGILKRVEPDDIRFVEENEEGLVVIFAKGFATMFYFIEPDDRAVISADANVKMTDEERLAWNTRIEQFVNTHGINGQDILVDILPD